MEPPPAVPVPPSAGSGDGRLRGGSGEVTDVPDSRAAEAELLARVAQGDRGAPLRDLYRRYEGRLYGLGVRLLGTSDLAEELVQETFLRVWRKARLYDPERGSVSTFVFTVARRIAIDLWRRPSSRPFAQVGGDGALTGQADGDDAFDRVLLALTVRDALDSLSAAHRHVLELTYTDGLRQAEIAERLGLPLGTVKTRCYYGLQALKLALEERGIDG